MRDQFLIVVSIIIFGLAITAIWYPGILWAFVILAPLILLGMYDILQKDHTILRNFPILGHFRYLFEMVSPEIQQYFIERNTDGTPICRTHRSLVYQRAKEELETRPFGTQLNIYSPDYNGLKHSMYPSDLCSEDFRVQIGGPDCKQPYSASVLNISAMSFGSLSKNAILALSKGARKGHFYHNTGEGAISSYHLEGEADLVWQIGTGYFGCRKADGCFDPEAFQERACLNQVKMIELKLSQGAKPGHGGVLPAEKNTKEIAEIRLVEAYTTIISPPGHREFSNAEGLLKFIQKLRDLSNGKPVGFKLCLGKKEEFSELCEKMKTTGIKPDFITVDGAEGGTGAAPLEFADSVGMPLLPALSFINRTLKDYSLREEIKIIASGKVISATSIMNRLAEGADLCNSARAFMLALGCIQALRCNSNTCPTGVATQDKMLVKGLVVEDKYLRVANFHKNTLHALRELMAAAGINSLEEITHECFLNAKQWEEKEKQLAV